MDSEIQCFVKLVRIIALENITWWHPANWQQRFSLHPANTIANYLAHMVHNANYMAHEVHIENYMADMVHIANYMAHEVHIVNYMARISLCMKLSKNFCHRSQYRK